MAKHFLYGFLYWAKTGKRSFGYLFSKRDYHHALDRYKQKQVIKTEKDEIDNEESTTHGLKTREFETGEPAENS